MCRLAGKIMVKFKVIGACFSDFEVGLKPSKDGPLASLNKHLARDLI
nr:hypothetical protein Q903MT_gene1362 [Picea sitchensis]